MSGDLVLTELFQAEQVELEKSLAIAMAGVGRQIAKRPEILRALAAAEQLKAGYTISTEEQAAELADLVAQVIDGEKALASAVNEAMRIPKRMGDALRGSVDDTKNRLASAKATGNRARVDFQVFLRRKAEEEAERRRQEAERAAREAAAAAAERGEYIPPVAEVEIPEVPRTVAGGAGKMGTQIRVEPVEIVNMAEVPDDWLTLVPAHARTWFAWMVKAGKIERPEPGESVVVNGVRFEARESAVNRR